MNWYKCNECGAKCCSDCAEDWGIDKDGEQAVICPACMDAMPDKLAAKDAEIERLKAVVDKLPLYADTQQPFIPGLDDAWVLHEGAFYPVLSGCHDESKGWGWVITPQGKSIWGPAYSICLPAVAARERRDV